jgi:hypothetical protein
MMNSLNFYFAECFVFSSGHVLVLCVLYFVVFLLATALQSNGIRIRNGEAIEDVTAEWLHSKLDNIPAEDWEDSIAIIPIPGTGYSEIEIKEEEKEEEDVVEPPQQQPTTHSFYTRERYNILCTFVKATNEHARSTHENFTTNVNEMRIWIAIWV